jgi:hypothetical protein
MDPRLYPKMNCHPACPGVPWDRSREAALREIEGGTWGLCKVGRGSNPGMNQNNPRGPQALRYAFPSPQTEIEE